MAVPFSDEQKQRLMKKNIPDQEIQLLEKDEYAIQNQGIGFNPIRIVTGDYQFQKYLSPPQGDMYCLYKESETGKYFLVNPDNPIRGASIERQHVDENSFSYRGLSDWEAEKRSSDMDYNQPLITDSISETSKAKIQNEHMIQRETYDNKLFLQLHNSIVNSVEFKAAKKYVDSFNPSDPEQKTKQDKLSTLLKNLEHAKNPSELIKAQKAINEAITKDAAINFSPRTQFKVFGLSFDRGVFKAKGHEETTSFKLFDQLNTMINKNTDFQNCKQLETQKTKAESAAQKMETQQEHKPPSPTSS